MVDPALRIWDISPPLSPASPVFPGDAPFSLEWTARIAPDNPVNVSALRFSPHTGAHVDAPLHYDDAGVPVGHLPLERFIGLCRVIHAMEAGPLVRPDDIDDRLEDAPPRVLIRTARKSIHDRWTHDFKALAPETIEYLHACAVQLVGIDTPSIDPADSHPLPSHQAARRLGLLILENLMLDDVDEGDYELIALPLKLSTAEASPVRAILRARPAG